MPRHFNPRSSCEERLSAFAMASQAALDFNPRSSCEERRAAVMRFWAVSKFQSTLLMRGATRVPQPIHRVSSSFQSTLLMRGATRLARRYFGQLKISIHAPHARSDMMRWTINVANPHFNPRSSCEERQERGEKRKEQTTISIHAPHARSDVEGPVPLVVLGISIHAPHARSDLSTLLLV